MYPALYFESSIYVGIDALVVSLRSVPYCLPTPPFLLLHWNSIASASKRMIQLVPLLISSPRIYRLRSWAIINGNSHSFAVCCNRWSTWPLSRYPERSSENLSTSCLITTYSRTLHRYTTRAITSRTHFDYILVITSIIKKQLRLMLWHNAFNSWMLMMLHGLVFFHYLASSIAIGT